MSMIKKQGSQGLIRRPPSGLPKRNKTPEKQENQKIQQSQDQDVQNSEKYEFVYEKAVTQLRILQECKSVKQADEDNFKVLCSLVEDLALFWPKQPEEIRKRCFRESLLQSLILIIKDIENPKVRLRSIKTSLIIVKCLDYNYIFQDQESKEIILGPDVIFSLLQQVLKEGLKISRDQKLDQLAIDENITQSYFEILNQVRLCLTPQQFNDRAVEILLAVFGIMKNEASNEILRKKYFLKNNLELCGYFLHFFDLSQADENFSKKIFNLYTQVTALLRNLAIEINCTIAYQQLKIIDKLSKSIELYPEIYELMLNTVRILSKLSLNKDCSLSIYQNQVCTKNLVGFYKNYKTNIFIIIRISFILANMTAFLEDIRKLIYFKFNAFKDIYTCFDYYTNQDLNPKKSDTIDKMGLTQTSWDFKILQKESDQEALIKIIRLLANLFTVEDIGIDIFNQKAQYFKDLIKKLKLLITNRDIKMHAELLTCSLSCLANTLFYEKQALVQDFEFKNTKLDLICVVAPLVIQAENEEICCEALRVISNLSRHKDLIKQIQKVKLADGVVILLESNSKEIVYYALGVLVNLLNTEEIKDQFGPQILESVLQIIDDCTLNESDLIMLSLKCLGNLLDLKKSIDQKYISKIEQVLINCGDQCDSVLKKKSEEKKSKDITEVMELRKLINQLLNNIPEEMYECKVMNCGRKFKSQEELAKHKERRHKI